MGREYYCFFSTDTVGTRVTFRPKSSSDHPRHQPIVLVAEH